MHPRISSLPEDMHNTCRDDIVNIAFELGMRVTSQTKKMNELQVFGNLVMATATLDRLLSALGPKRITPERVATIICQNGRTNLSGAKLSLQDMSKLGW